MPCIPPPPPPPPITLQRDEIVRLNKRDVGSMSHQQLVRAINSRDEHEIKARRYPIGHPKRKYVRLSRFMCYRLFIFIYLFMCNLYSIYFILFFAVSIAS